MSFTINFKPQDPITRQASGTAQLLELALPSDHPDFPKHTRFLSLLCSQINQISGMSSEAGEQDVNSDGPSENHHCWQCNNLSTTHISDGMKPIVRGFLCDFEASARRGCEICLLLLTAISPYQGPGRLKAYIRPGAALNILVKCANKNARYDLFTPIGQPISPWPGIGQAGIIALKISADDRLVGILQSWLKDCKAHEICQSANVLNISPTRIINVANDQLRLEEPGSLREPYLALSHCWGSSNLPRATKATMELLKNSINWNTLTKTFQDAIMLTRKLGLHYIWIDSLCIIQDDENDWRVEASKMAGIYENAELVVSATGSRDGSEGLFRERKPVQILASDDTQDSSTVREYGSFHRVIHMHGPECKDKDCPIYICRDTARHAQWDSFDLIAQSSNQFNPLLTRAWAFQERLLATRIVHFADHELVWECKETQRCECMHLDRSDGRPILERSSDNIKLRFSKDTSTSQPSRVQLQLYELWAKVVENYTERVLTFEKDRLPALDGAVRKMQKLNLGPCIGGLFLSEIPRCLLWYVSEPGTRHEVYRAPTWSWASIMPPTKQPPRIKYRWHHYSEGLGTYNYFPEEACIEPLGPITEEPQFGLHLRGPLISATLNIKITNQSYLNVDGGYGFMLHDTPPRNYWYSISRNEQSISFEPDILLHMGCNDMEYSCEVSLVAIARRFNQKKADQILVLKRLESEEDYAGIGMLLQKFEDPVFSRIGIITELKDDGKDWFDDAEKKPMIIF